MTTGLKIDIVGVSLTKESDSHPDFQATLSLQQKNVHRYPQESAQRSTHFFLKASPDNDWGWNMAPQASPLHIPVQLQRQCL